MSLSLEGKVALITGATSGIGLACAHLFAQEGAKLVLSGRDQAKGVALCDTLHREGAQAIFLAAELRHPDSAKRLVDLAIERFGKLNIALNNAGVEAVGALTSFDDEVYARVFDTNVRALFYALKEQAAAMRLAAQGGSIILTSSAAGQRGFSGASVYVASKHAVEGLVKAAALELAADQIRVNALAPGHTATPMINRLTQGDHEVLASQVPMGRLAESQEIAQAALWLASDASSFVSGTALAVDGGLSAS